MGLDAVVRCRCWEEGKTTSFEHPELLHLEEGLVALRLKWSSKTQPLFEKLDRWLETCCAHPRMVLRKEWIANWYGVSDFRSALLEIGEQKFPALIAELPRNNGGQTAPQRALQCLDELETFLEAPPFGVQVWVVNADTGSRLQQCSEEDFAAILIPRPKKLFARKRKVIEIGAGANGIFVKDRNVGELFRAKHVRQVKLRKKEIQLIDPETGASIVAPDGFGVATAKDDQGRWIYSYPEYIRIDVSPNTPDEYAGIVQRLREIFRASSISGNPVLWT